MKGYIKLFRQIVDSDIWKLKPFSEGQAWIDLLCITNFEKGFIKTKNGQIITLNRGDCGYSMLTLSERWGWSRGKTKRFLDFLTEQQMIQQKMCGKHTVLLISNFEKYQMRTTNDTTNDTTNGQQMIQQTDTIKKNKEEKEEKEENKLFIVPKIEEIENYCNERNNKINPLQFYDYYQSKGWMIGKNKMKDWQAAVRTWEQKNKANSSPTPYREYNPSC